MKRLFILLFTLVFWINSYSRTFFVSSTLGNDSNSGLTTAAPWKTLSKVSLSAFLPGDVVLFMRNDIFVGTLNVSSNGSVGNSITYGAYGAGSIPVITGLATINAFTNLGANIWESTSTVSTRPQLNMVIIGGNNTPMGRTPNTGYYTISAATGATSITSTSLNAAVINWTGAEAVIRKVAWKTDRNLISSASGTTINFPDIDGLNSQVGWGFFIEDDVRTLDLPGEWYYNPTTKKLRIFSTIAPTNVQVGTIDTLVRIQNHHDITFDGIKFTGSNLLSFAISAANVTIQNCQFDYSGVDCIWGGANAFTSTGFVFQNNTINHTNNNAVLIRSNFVGAIITGNTIANSGIQEGMMNRVSNSNGFGNGIQIRAANVPCTLNSVFNSGYAGIEFFGNNILIQNNFVNGALLTLGDGGGIYTWVGEGTGTAPFTGCQVLNNIVLNCVGSNAGTTFSSPPLTQGQGIYMDDLTANIEIGGNTVAYCGFSSYFLHNTQNMNIHDNTGYSSNRVFEYSSSDAAKPIRTTTLKNNQFIAATTTQLSAFASSSTMIANDIQQFGNSTTIDSNIYALPLADNITIKSNINTSPGVFVLGSYNLAMWKTFCAYDPHSTKSPIAITSASQLFFAYNPTNADSTVILPAGSWIDFKSVSYATSTVLHAYASVVLLASGTQTTPVINWSNPAAITYGTPLSAIQLNATVSGGIPGTFTYTPAAGTILNAGTSSLNVLFTPTDGTAYTTASKTVTIVVNKATATLSYSNLTQIYTGNPLQPTVTTSPAGLTVVNTTYNGVGAMPINAGSYAIVSGLNNQNYQATPISNTFVINKATATINLSNLNQLYDGTPKPVTVSTSPIGLSGLSVLYNGSATVPTNAGSYPIVVSLSNTNYQATNATGTLVIAKATPTVSWSNPGNIVFGTALSGTQLNASASVAGTFTYTPANGTILNAGTQTLSVNFTPADGTNYNSVNNTTVTIIVTQASATINVSNLTQFFDGNPKPVTVSTTPAALGVITTTYNGSTTPPSAPGSYPVHVTLTNSNYTATPFDGTLVISNSAANIFITNLNQVYTGSPLPVTVTTNPTGLAHTDTYNGSATVPTNVGSYTVIAKLNSPFTGADTEVLVISKATPIITWPNPASISFGTALSGIQLNATANVAGTFAYTPASGAQLNVGTSLLSVVFTPTDASNYNVVSATVPITVTNGSATLTLSNTGQTYDGTQKAVIVTTNPVGLSGVSITYNGSPTVPTNAGTYTINVTLTNANYTASPVTGTLVIAQAIPILSWNVPAPIQFGTILTSTQLNATSNIAGTFSYNYPIGTQLPEGTISVTATFTPTDAVNYASAQISVPISVFGDPVLLYYIIHGGTYYDNLPGQNFNFPP